MPEEKITNIQPNISEMSVTELKALVYDQVALAEQCQKNIQILNAEIHKRPQENGINNTGAAALSPGDE